MNLNIYNDDDDIYDLSLYLIDIITQDYPMIYNNSNYKDIIYEEIELLLDIPINCGYCAKKIINSLIVISSK